MRSNMYRRFEKPRSMVASLSAVWANEDPVVYTCVDLSSTSEIVFQRARALKLRMPLAVSKCAPRRRLRFQATAAALVRA
jgi:hypothetical protein